MALATFHYLVLDRSGKRQEVSIDAVDTSNARSRLAAKGYTPLRELQFSGGTGTKKSFWTLQRGKFDANVFTARLAPLLLANVPLEKALAVLEEGASDRKMAEVIFELRRGLHEGRRFSAVIRQLDKEFPPMYASLVETGEEAGCLPEVIDELRSFMEESKNFRDFVVTSSIYPTIVLLVTIGVVILLFTVFIPRFARIFEDMGRELPALTQTLVDISNILVDTWWLLPLFLLAVILLNRYCGRNSLWQRFKDKIMVRIPLLGRLAVSIQVSTFIQSLSIMVKKSVHLLSAVRIARNTISNSVIRDSFAGVEEELRDGEKLSHALGRNVYMPVGSIAMLQIAEESGETGEMLARITAEQQKHTRNLVKKLLSLLEPAIIILLALVVMTVVFAIFAAIWEMNSIR